MRIGWRFVILGMLAVAAATRPVLATQIPKEDPSLSRLAGLLNEYAAGGSDPLASPARFVEDLRLSGKDWRSFVEVWVRRDGDVQAPHRRRIAASLVLELIGAARVEEQAGLTSILAWAADLVTTDAPSEAERLWHHAAIGLAQGMRNWSVLSISRARGRFPEDRRLAFAELQVLALQSVAPWRGWAGTVDSAVTNYRVDRFLERATGFFADPQIGGEAHLWSGLLLLLNQQKGAAAMAQFSAAGNDPDPFVAYLARYSAGRLQEARGATGPSEAAYRGALAVWPRAQSASLSLASLLFAGGRPDEAYQLVADAYREPTVADPFREYGFGQHRRVDRAMAELRKELWR
jgi:hypothetical protein